MSPGIFGGSETLTQLPQERRGGRTRPEDTMARPAPSCPPCPPLPPMKSPWTPPHPPCGPSDQTANSHGSVFNLPLPRSQSQVQLCTHTVFSSLAGGVWLVFLVLFSSSPASSAAIGCTNKLIVGSQEQNATSL